MLSGIPFWSRTGRTCSCPCPMSVLFQGRGVRLLGIYATAVNHLFYFAPWNYQRRLSSIYEPIAKSSKEAF